MVQFDDEKQSEQLADIHKREEEALVQQTAQKIGVAYIDLTGVGIDTDALKILLEEEARRLEMAVFKAMAKNIHLAARSPLREATQDKINELMKQGYQISLYMVSQKSLEKAWDRYKDVSLAFETSGGLLDISEASLKDIIAHVKTNEDVAKLFTDVIEQKIAHKVSRLMEILFGSGIATGASDIHIEPGQDEVHIRFRQDGVLHEVVTLSHDVNHMLNSRIKLLSGLKLTQTQDAQDGRFSIAFDGAQIEIRTSVVPSAYGEGIVMRILNPKGINVGLEQLGIPKRLLDILIKEVGKPNGLILTTGPTGSGKTTTLYSFLKYLYSPEIKIITIEDPIEYHLPGITQTQVDHDKGYDFLAGLRAAMRQDPDIALVGEIRDNETATIAVNASLTGHLVLSTLHTNNAAGAIPRLLDLGVIPGVLAAALSVSIAQRLVRKLCEHCKEETIATDEEEHILRTTIENARVLGKDFSGANFELGDTIKIFKPKGCEKCANIGYKGRLGVYEAILADEDIQKTLESHPSEREVKIVSSIQGILTMKEDGVSKILGGITSLEEIQSVIDLEEDLELFPEMKEYVEKHRKIITTEAQTAIAPANQSAPSSTTSVPFLPSQTLSSENSTTTEISLLIEYLKVLETSPSLQTDENIQKKIQTIEHTVTDILRRNPNTIGAVSEIEQTQGEIDLLMRELSELRNEKNTPSGTATILRNLREKVEQLSA
ncbi:MAG: type II/IV secretion system protein [Candidatus Pacebacteria bacterium]|nr:type II/IV secretion system protein [Candidatus Paceibacterota bacterium]